MVVTGRGRKLGVHAATMEESFCPTRSTLCPKTLRGVVHADDGRPPRREQEHGGAHLEDAEPAVPAHQGVQTVDRSRLSSAELVDVVDLYADPPEWAAVFSFDKNSSARSAAAPSPSLPMRSGQAKTMTHDYQRHDTTDLFAVLNIAVGEGSAPIIFLCQPTIVRQTFQR